MRSFTDTEGRTWQVRVDNHAIRRVRDLVGLDLYNGVLTQEDNAIDRLCDDAVLLVNTIYAVCKPQADAAGVSDVQFGEALIGDVIDAATDALLDAVVAFFPKGRRRVLAKVLEKTRAIREKAVELATAKLDSPKIDQAMRAITERAMAQAEAEIDQMAAGSSSASTSSPASSASTPAR